MDCPPAFFLCMAMGAPRMYGDTTTANYVGRATLFVFDTQQGRWHPILCWECQQPVGHARFLSGDRVVADISTIQDAPGASDSGASGSGGAGSGESQYVPMHVITKA